MLWFVLGLIIGIAVMLPVVLLAARRTARGVRRLEQRARTNERLAELGTLTGGLAHEIKNPLSTIGLNLQLMRETLDEMELAEPQAGRVTRRLDGLDDQVHRLRAILEDFLSFAGRVRLDAEDADLNAVVEQLVDFYLPQAEASGVQLRSQLDPNVAQVRLDTTLFKQALLNLLINATQAMVEARYGEQAHGGSQDLIVRTEAGRDEVRVHVTDTGPGVDAESGDRIFHPYFSTKKGGTGLGLATTRRIIDEHGGHITVHSDPGRGSDFVITLPREHDAAEPTLD